MKKINFFVALFVAMLTFVSCEQRSLKDLIVDEDDTPTEQPGTNTEKEDGSSEYPYKVTVAEFISKEVDDDVWYELKGVITGTINTTYGNFDLEDSTGKVYVYGLTATKQSSNDNSYESLGLVAGDKIKIRGTRGDYNGKVEVLNAFFVEKVTDDDDNSGSSDSAGLGTQDSPYNVAAASAKQGEKDKWVEGYVVGVYNFDAVDKFVFGLDTIKTNILIADKTGKPSEYMAVQLPSGEIRTALNIVDNPSNIGKKVKVYGSLEKYCGVEGVKSLIKAEIDGTLIDCEVVVSDATPVTVAEFIEKPVDSKVWYELTGVITGTINADYGNFDLIDETGTVYVYGLTATPQSGNDKSYASLGLEAGDKIKIHGTRGDYNGKIEVLNAYFVELVQKQAGEPEVDMGDPESATPATIEEFLSKPVNGTVWYELIGTVKEFAVKDGTTDNAMIYGNFTLEDATGTVYVYGLTKEPVTKNDQSFASLGVEVGDRIKIRGVRAEYNGEAQVGKAYLIEELEPEKPQMEGAEGEGTEASPYNVPAAYNNQGAEEAVWVEGYIVGFINRRDSDKPTFVTDGCKEKSNVLIAKEANDTVVYMPIELPSGALRDALNLQANPTNLGKKVKVNGMLQEFFFMPGVKGITKAYLEETLIPAE